MEKLNRRLRSIWEEEKMDYGDNDVTDVEEMVRRLRTTMDIRRVRIQAVMRDIKMCNTVDLCFVIDATSSMKSHIAGVQQSITKVVKTLDLAAKTPGRIEKLRFAVVAYRDFDHPRQFEVLDFQSDWLDCLNFCGQIRAYSSASRDAPEDVLGGLEKALSLKWSSIAGTKIIFHLCDSPCHGRQYHTQMLNDHYPDGDPEGRTPETIFKKMKDMKVNYFFGKITTRTDKMLEEFTKHYGQITDFSVEQVTDIASSVIESITTAIDQNVEATTLALKFRSKPLHFQLDPVIPDWDDIVAQEGYFIVYELPESVAALSTETPLIERQVRATGIKVAPRPFDQGAERIAYHGQETNPSIDRRSRNLSRGRGLSAYASRFGAGPVPIVLKEFKFELSAEAALQRYKLCNEIQAVASFLAKRFNGVHHQASPLKFLKTKTLVLHSHSLTNRPMTYEKKIIGKTEFVKFTNNAGYSLRANSETRKIYEHLVDLVMAFSHWTYKETNGFLMVVDLQGCICDDTNRYSGLATKKVLLTDPAIHSLNLTKFGETNLGKEGMLQFFKSHRCNSICLKLGLLDHKPRD